MKQHYLYILYILVLFPAFSGCNISSEKVLDEKSILHSYKVLEHKEKGVDIETIGFQYLSDGLKVGAFLIKPKVVDSKLPLIIYNRGGNKSFSTISTRVHIFLSIVASQGYIVVAPQLRGNFYSEGRDEFGGKDLNDVLNCIDLAKEFSFVDPNSIGVVGASRGAMMTYLVSKERDDIKAICGVAGVSNLLEAAKDRPRMYTHVYEFLIGDSITHKQDYIDRSAIFWADKINEPTLIIHSRDDLKVDFMQSKLLVDQLKLYNPNVEFAIHENSGHTFNRENQVVRNTQIIEFFNKYLK